MGLDFSILKKLRKLKRVTLKELSEKSGVSLQALTKVENNKTNPTIGTLQNICNYFEMDVTNLVQWAEIGHPKKFYSETKKSENYLYTSFRINNIVNTYVEMREGTREAKTVGHNFDYELCHLISGKLIVEYPERCEQSEQ